MMRAIITVGAVIAFLLAQFFCVINYGHDIRGLAVTPRKARVGDKVFLRAVEASSVTVWVAFGVEGCPKPVFSFRASGFRYVCPREGLRIVPWSEKGYIVQSVDDEGFVGVTRAVTENNVAVRVSADSWLEVFE